MAEIMMHGQKNIKLQLVHFCATIAVIKVMSLRYSSMYCYLRFIKIIT